MSQFSAILKFNPGETPVSALVRTDGSFAPRPEARCEVSVRQATVNDLAFVDQLQKMHSHMVGFMPSKQIEKYITDGHVVIAEDRHKTPLGYCMYNDVYLKREEVGIIYQLNVLPLKQRHLIGATLVKAVFDRSAYGCKLYCCWCAQDIQANWFWESIGFVPLAFRTGSRAKQRIHIFWQRRIREGDTETPYWFPSQTQNGAVAEDRIVLPIPPGTHWRDAKPLVLPGMPVAGPEMPKTLPGGQPVRVRPEQPKLSKAERIAITRMQSAHLGGVPLGKKAVISGGRIKYVDRKDFNPETDVPEALLPPPKPKREPKPKQKNDPKWVSAARDLRDCFLENVNASMLLPPGACGNYDVSRQLENAPSAIQPERIALPKAA